MRTTLTTQADVDAFVAQTEAAMRAVDRSFAVSCATIAKGPTVVNLKLRTAAFNDAVRAGVVFG